jgi:hypothetical protein
MVGTAGFEPATAGLEIRCSIRLSYAPVKGYLSDFTTPLQLHCCGFADRRRCSSTDRTGELALVAEAWKE